MFQFFEVPEEHRMREVVTLLDGRTFDVPDGFIATVIDLTYRGGEIAGFLPDERDLDDSAQILLYLKGLIAEEEHYAWMRQPPDPSRARIAQRTRTRG